MAVCLPAVSRIFKAGTDGVLVVWRRLVILDDPWQQTATTARQRTKTDKRAGWRMFSRVQRLAYSYGYTQ